jgi:hypothetical protein
MIRVDQVYEDDLDLMVLVNNNDLSTWTHGAGDAERTLRGGGLLHWSR